jgi:hypothetical protein
LSDEGKLLPYQRKLIHMTICIYLHMCIVNFNGFDMERPLKVEKINTSKSKYNIWQHERSLFLWMVEGWNHIKLFFLKMTPPIFKMVKGWSRTLKSRISKRSHGVEKGWKSNCQNNSQLLFQCFECECELFRCLIYVSFWLQFALTMSFFLFAKIFVLSSTYWVHFNPIFLSAFFCFNVPMCGIKENAKSFQIFCSVVH